LSHLMHKPVLAISYSIKVDALMEDIGLSEYCIDINCMDLDSIKNQFGLLESNKDAVTRQIENKVSGYVRALEEQYRYLFQHSWFSKKSPYNRRSLETGIGG